jgi:hypothetical protein
MTRFITFAPLALILVGCGGTYVDDKHNFERALNFKCPKDVQVGHSIYYQSPHFTEEHCYYLELIPASNSTFLATFTTAPGIVLVTNKSQDIPTIGLERPKWFAPKPRESYEIWVFTNEFVPFGILHDKLDNRVFVYGSIGM